MNTSVSPQPAVIPTPKQPAIRPRSQSPTRQGSSSQCDVESTTPATHPSHPPPPHPACALPPPPHSLPLALPPPPSSAALSDTGGTRPGDATGSGTRPGQLRQSPLSPFLRRPPLDGTGTRPRGSASRGSELRHSLTVLLRVSCWTKSTYVGSMGGEVGPRSGHAPSPSLYPVYASGRMIITTPALIQAAGSEPVFLAGGGVVRVPRSA